MERLLPHLAVRLPQDGSLDPRRLFDRPVTEVWLEIGFGSGEHLAWQAEHHPDVGLIGCEPFLNGVSSLCKLIEERRLDTVRILADDARPLIDRLPDASIGRVFLLFPDPWPKRKHWRRRFVQMRSLDDLARIMTDGAELRLASDDAPLADWMLWHGLTHPAFEWTAGRAEDWRTRPADWPQTRYEAKALHGAPVFLTFRRRPRGDGAAQSP